MAEQVIIEFLGDTKGLEEANAKINSLSKAEAELIAIQKSSSQPAILKQVNEQLNKVQAEMKETSQAAGNLSKDFKKVSDSVKVEAGIKAIDTLGKNLNETVNKSKSLTAQLRAMKLELSKMDEAGQSGSKAFLKMSVEAAKLEDQIGDTAKRIRTLASDTKNIDAVIGVVSGLASAFSVAQGAAALLGDENEDVQKALLKVQAAMSIANGIQQISNLLQKESAVVLGIKRAQLALTAAATGLFSGATSLATIATAAWNAVLNLNPIVAIGTAITLAVGAIYQFVKGTDTSTESLKKQNEELAKQKQLIIESGEAFERTLKRSDEVIDTGNQNIINNLETQIKLAKIRGAGITEVFNLEKKLIESRLILLKNSGNADTAEYNALLNDKLVLTAQYYKDLSALAFEAGKKQIEGLKTGGVGAGLPGDVSSIPEVISFQTVEDFKTQLTKQGEEARFKIRQEKSQEQQEADKAVQQQLLNTSIDFANQLFAFGNTVGQARISNLDEQLKKGVISEKKYAAEVAKIKTKQAVSDKAAALFGISINTALAVAKAAGQTGIGAPFVVPLILALGLAQAATVLAQPIPKFAKGTETVKGGTPGRDSVLAMLMPGERIVPEHINKQLQGIKNEDLPKYLTPALPFISDSDLRGIERSAQGYGIDYDLLGKSIAKQIDKHTKVAINIDEKGFHKNIIKNMERTKVIDSQFSWNG